MRYCATCWEAFEFGKCPVCGAKKSRELEEADPVFLLKTSGIWVDTIEEILRDNGIPTVRRGAMGAFLTSVFGQPAETYEIGVRHDDLARARELADNFLHSAPEETPEETPEEETDLSEADSDGDTSMYDL